MTLRLLVYAIGIGWPQAGQFSTQGVTSYSTVGSPRAASRDIASSVDPVLPWIASNGESFIDVPDLLS
jgi:hypothetical protein